MLQPPKSLLRAFPRIGSWSAESGLKGPADLARMARAGVRCFLVGESLMAQADVEAATRALLAPPGAVAAARARA